jgi:hypothetical protein
MSLSSPQLAIEVCSIEIEAVNVPVFPHCKHENRAEGSEVGNRRISFKVIGAEYLCESSCDKASFVLVHAAVRLVLDSKNPLVANNVAASGAQDSFPSPCVFECLYLAIHRLLP